MVLDLSDLVGEVDGGPATGQMPGVRKRMHELYTEHRGMPIVVGKAPGADSINLSSNDYLCLGSDSRLAEAQARFLKRASRSRFDHRATRDRQRQVENKFAAFVGAEDAVLCQSGYVANDGLIQCLSGEGMPVYVDMFAHASIWQGASSGLARAIPFRHNSPRHLRSMIAQYGPGVVAVDAVYSTLGSICPCEERSEVCEETGSLLIVDESHSAGLYGPYGEGLVQALGLADRVHYRTLSLSKTFVSRAGLVVGPKRVMDYFRANAWPVAFSSSMEDWEIDRIGAVLDIIKFEHAPRRRLFAMASRLREDLIDLGYNLDLDNSPILPLIAGPVSKTHQLRDALEDRGVFGAVFCAPATPKKRSLLRLSVHVGLTDSELSQVVETCREILPLIDLASWPSGRRRKRKASLRASKLSA